MSTTSDSLAATIQTDYYLRQRMAPQPGDSLYLHLADLRMAIDRIRSDDLLAILDYGSGGSPYRSLFPQADYRRADFLQADSDQLDYALDEYSRVQEASETFDLVLSTQVAEHVSDPAIYFAECFRLLRPGGRLYCTTHGSFEDHGVPYDFQRWTADGLRRDIAKAGFEIIGIEKLTTGPRALLFQIDHLLNTLRAPNRSALGIALAIVRRLIGRFRVQIHQQCDLHFGQHRVVAQQLEQHPVYIGLAALARRPEAV
jgi:SAM-dependent methyltransferase